MKYVVTTKTYGGTKQAEIWATDFIENIEIDKNDKVFLKYVDAYAEMIIVMLDNGHSIDQFENNPHFNEVIRKIKESHPEHFI